MRKSYGLLKATFPVLHPALITTQPKGQGGGLCASNHENLAFLFPVLHNADDIHSFDPRVHVHRYLSGCVA